MNAREYIAELTRLLHSLPDQEREEAVSFYRESIADRMDEGLTEEEAVDSMVQPAEAARVILSNRAEPLEPVPLMEEAVSDAHGQAEEAAQRPSFWARLKRGQLTPWEWVGVILGSVIWLPMLALAFGLAVTIGAVILVLYLCLWVLIACVWITGAALVVAAPANCLFILWGLQLGNVPSVLVNVGYSLVAFGGGAWILRGASALTKLFLRGHKSVACLISRTPRVPKTAASPVPPVPRPGMTAFFRICLILMGAGIACVLAGYLLSGFDWRVFLASINGDGRVTIGGTQATFSELLPFGRA